jgi:hypothetical protein
MCKLTYPDPSLIDNDNHEHYIDHSFTEVDNISHTTDSIKSMMDVQDHVSDDDDELSHSPSYYRFRPSVYTVEGTSITPSVRQHYIALIEDAFHDREFHQILGKELVGGEMHYLVDWVPTLVRSSVLRRAKAQSLINEFEANCENQRKRKRRQITVTN